MVGSIAGVFSHSMLPLQQQDLAERLPMQIELLLLVLHHVEDLLYHGRDLAWARGLKHLGGLELLHGHELGLLPGQLPHQLRQRQGRPRLLQWWQRLPRREAMLQRLLMRGHRLHRLGYRLHRLGHRPLRYPQRQGLGGRVQ